MSKKAWHNFLILTVIVFSAFILIQGAPLTASAEVIGSATLDGIVTDGATAEPIAGAAVTVRDKIAKSGRDGHYSATGLIPGRIIVEVRHRDYDNFVESISVARGENSFNVKLRPKTGRIALSNAFPPPAKKPLTITSETEETGRGISASSPAAESAYGAEYNYTTPGEPGSVKRHISANVKNTKLLLSKMFITGKVMDMVTGVPISRARVTIDGESYFTDPAGEFTSKQVDKAFVMVRAESPNHTAYESNVKMGNGKNKIRILLMPHEREKNLVSHNGIEKNAVVEYTRFNQRFARVFGVIRNARSKEPVSNATIVVGTRTDRTDKQGNYSVEGIALGQADVSVIAGSFGVYRGRLEVNDVSKKFDINLTPEQNFGTVSGVIMEKESGKYIHGAKVTISDRVVVSDAAGNFVIKDVPYDYYNMIVEQKGYQRAERAISVNQGGVNFTVELADEFPQAKR